MRKPSPRGAPSRVLPSSGARSGPAAPRGWSQSGPSGDQPSSSSDVAQTAPVVPAAHRAAVHAALAARRPGEHRRLEPLTVRGRPPQEDRPRRDVGQRKPSPDPSEASLHARYRAGSPVQRVAGPRGAPDPPDGPPWSAPARRHPAPHGLGEARRRPDHAGSPWDDGAGSARCRPSRRRRRGRPALPLLRPVMSIGTVTGRRCGGGYGEAPATWPRVPGSSPASVLDHLAGRAGTPSCGCSGPRRTS